METSDPFRGLECTRCETRFDRWEPGRCPDCGAPLTTRYDLGTVDPETIEPGTGPPEDGHWRYDPLLPFPAEQAVTAAEGATPIVASDRLAAELGIERLLIKDEGRNPTGTVLDRGMSVAMTAAKAEGTEPVALAAAGNAGQSAAAYAGRADLRSYAFVPSRTAFSNKAMVNVHGGQMRVVGGRYPAAVAALDEQLAAEYQSLQEFDTPYRQDGARTLAFELHDALGEAPDGVVLPVGTGEVLVGVVDGFWTLRALDLIEALPEVYAVQPEGCAPVVDAWDAGESVVDSWATPDTIVGELEIPAPSGGGLAIDALERTDGGAVAVSDDQALESAVTVAQREIMEVGGAGGVALAGAWALAEDGQVDSTDTIVVVNPDAGVKTPDVLRSHLMGQGV